jgi:hypothetical protein
VGYTAGTTERERYASALAGLWGGLATTLARLETVAADPQSLEDAFDRLPGLQYGLHRSAELVGGITPPHGSEHAHAELAAALEIARDVTGDVREVLESEGAETAFVLVHEWRAALFGVRLARHRLALVPAVQPPEPEPEVEAGLNWSAACATALVLAGTAAFAAGALMVLWPVWALGLGLTALSFLVFR